MDRELIEYFDRRFDETNEATRRRFDDSDRRNGERFAALGARIDETNQRLDKTNQRLDEANEATRRHFDDSDRRNGERFAALGARIDEGQRHNRVLMEDLTVKLELVIEGVMGFRQELKQDVADVRAEVREVQTRLEVSHVLLDRQIQAGGADA